MSRSALARLVGLLLLALVYCAPRTANAGAGLIFSGVHLSGTNQLSPENVISGLGLKVGAPTNRQRLTRACERFLRLKLFGSSRCTYTVRQRSAWLRISVKPAGLPVVFDNFVWTNRAKLLARLKKQIPLFMPDLPPSSGLTDSIIRVLQDVVNERGIKGRVSYDAHFWTIRGMNVFYVDGISTPVKGLQVVGENSPSVEATRKFSKFYTKEQFSAARLTWVVMWIERDLYRTRGYLRPVVRQPVVQFLGERDDTYPVRVILHISSGPLYMFKSVQFEGLAKMHTATLLSKWKLKPGSPYNESYANDFIYEEILSEPWAKYSGTESDVALPCARIDNVTKSVSLIVTLERPRKVYRTSRRASEGCGGVVETLTLSP